MQTEFSDIITTESQLREIIGLPAERNLLKVQSALDAHCRAFIAKSPFMLLSTADSEGRVDVSPKGDPPGFVRVLDDNTLAIPDRPGNRRADSLTNIIQNPRIGLLFLIPGKRETLRVSGTAKIVRDEALRASMAERGKVPTLAIVVDVEETFLHCAKCVIRSQLWEAEAWPEQNGIASLAQVIIDQTKVDLKVDEYQEMIDVAYRDELY
jgi:PPOX class probable FMN-dependent enzyme